MNFIKFSVALCEPSVYLCVTYKLRTYTEEHREEQRNTEKFMSNLKTLNEKHT